MALFATENEVLRKAGSGANALAISSAAITDFLDQAEGYINVASRYNWSDNFSGSNADVRTVLKEVASNLAAVYCIQSDMSGYSSIQEAQSKMDVLHQRAMEGLVILREKKGETFMKGA